MRSTRVWSARFTQSGRRRLRLERDDDNERSAGSLTAPLVFQMYIKRDLLSKSLSSLPSSFQGPKHQLVNPRRSSHPKLNLHPRGTNQAFIMKAFTITAALVVLARLSQAAPAPVPTLVPCPQCLMLDINATFLGAGPDPPSYTVPVVTNSGIFVICMSTSTQDTYDIQFLGSYTTSIQ